MELEGIFSIILLVLRLGRVQQMLLEQRSVRPCFVIMFIV